MNVWCRRGAARRRGGAASGVSKNIVVETVGIPSSSESVRRSALRGLDLQRALVHLDVQVGEFLEALLVDQHRRADDRAVGAGVEGVLVHRAGDVGDVELEDVAGEDLALLDALLGEFLLGTTGRSIAR